MPRTRTIDNSEAKCRECGKLYQPGDAVYSIADRYDPEDENKLIEFCHWDCHVPLDQMLDQLRGSIHRAEGALNRFKDRIR